MSSIDRILSSAETSEAGESKKLKHTRDNEDKSKRDSFVPLSPTQLFLLFLLLHRAGASAGERVDRICI